MNCRYCGEDADRLILMGLLSLAGARCSPDCDYCSDSPDNEHHFKKEDAVEQEEVKAQ